MNDKWNGNRKQEIEKSQETRKPPITNTALSSYLFSEVDCRMNRQDSPSNRDLIKFWNPYKEKYITFPTRKRIFL